MSMNSLSVKIKKPIIILYMIVYDKNGNSPVLIFINKYNFSSWTNIYILIKYNFLHF